MEKCCFKCNQWLPLTEFYSHSAMSDGHLGKCKDCARKDVRENYRAQREKKRVYEHERNQRPERRAAKLRYQRESRRRHPEKVAAHNAVANAIRDGRLKRQPCRVCGEWAEGHHFDYSKPLDVDWLCFKHHREQHGQVAA